MSLARRGLLGFRPSYPDLSSAQTKSCLPFIQSAPNGSRAAPQATPCMGSKSLTKATAPNSAERFSIEGVGLRSAKPTYRLISSCMGDVRARTGRIL